MSEVVSGRRVVPLRRGFLNDGHWYVLSSTSLGGSGIGPAEMVLRLCAGEASFIRDMVQGGICLPLEFDGDCALDRVTFIVGELTVQEEMEWIGRIQARLEIPCGEFFILGGGGCEENWVDATSNFEAPDPHYVNFSKFKVEPGTYLVELYAFVGSMTINAAWDGDGQMTGIEESPDSLRAWWESTRPDEPFPPWLQSHLVNGAKPIYELDLLEYLIRLKPWIPGTELLAPPVESSQWCGTFEYRRDIPCPRGILSANYLQEMTD